MTQIEKFRQMTDEELAEAIVNSYNERQTLEYIDDWYCQNICPNRNDEHEGCSSNISDVDKVKIYLNSEV